MLDFGNIELVQRKVQILQKFEGVYAAYHEQLKKRSRYRWVERLLCRSKAWNRGYRRRCNWVASSEHVKDFGRLLSPARVITAGPDTEINPDDSASNNVPSRASHLTGLQNLSLFQVKFGGELSRLFSISCKKKGQSTKVWGNSEGGASTTTYEESSLATNRNRKGTSRRTRLRRSWSVLCRKFCLAFQTGR